MINYRFTKINLLEVEVVKTEGHTDKIVLDEETGIGIKLKYPNVSMAIEASKSNEGKNVTNNFIFCFNFPVKFSKVTFKIIPVTN